MKEYKNFASMALNGAKGSEVMGVLIEIYLKGSLSFETYDNLYTYFNNF